MALALMAGWAAYSYRSGGLIFVLDEAVRRGSGSIDLLRAYLTSWGALGPVAYVLLVIVEVLVAPLPGTLLYAPGGALFGGFVGGTLSLIGNVVGAMIACIIGRLAEGRLSRVLDHQGLAAVRHRLASRGAWMIFLLRVNPLTSSDLVSYGAGMIGVPVWKVALGTLAGMAPLSYAQAHLAERVIDVLPGSLWVVVVLGAAYAAAIVWLLAAAGRRRPRPG